MNHHKNALIMLAAASILVGAGCSGTPSPQVPGSTTTANTPVVTVPAVPESNKLDLSGKGLTSVPSDVFGKSELEGLDLSNNQLTGALPAEIRHLQRLRTLDASGNKMTGVPAEIGQLSALVDLDLSENQLTGLPTELGNLHGLLRLDLRGNKVSKQDLDGIRSKLTNTEILE